MNTLAIKEKRVTNIQELIHYYDILGYEPELSEDNSIIIKTPVEFIVCISTKEKPLSIFDIHCEINSLKETSNFTGIENYILISTSGYEESCYNIDGYSIRLEDGSYLDKIRNATIDKKPIELLPHNHFAYKKIMKMWEEERLVSLVQATGTGKSYIVAKILENSNKRAVVICPTNEILHQFNDLFITNGINTNKIDFLTYSKLSMIEDKDLLFSDYGYIFIDEFHRAGASKWGEGIKNLININTNAKILGTTATPIRHLDSERNMIDELFDGNLSNSLDLFEAMSRGILPVPKYIEAIYDIADDIQNLELNLSESLLPTEKKAKVIEKIKQFKVSWDKTNSISTIIQKHFSKDINKVVVFCKDTNHLKHMIPLVCKWFEKSNIYNNINAYSSYSTKGDKKDELNDFKKDIKYGDLNILFSINKLSEGIHVENVSAVIFLRNTASNNIFFQQLGRAFSASSNKKPIILDLINNIEILEYSSFYNHLSKAIEKFEKKKEAILLPDRLSKKIDLEFSIIDETKDFIDFIKETNALLKCNWEDYFNQSLECRDETGWFPCKFTPSKSPILINWVKRQRSLYNQKLLLEDRKQKLVNAGFKFSLRDEIWFYMYNKLLKYKNDNNLDTLFRHNVTDTELAEWIEKQRKRKFKGNLSKEQFELLTSIGVSINILEDKFDYYVNRLVKFFEENGHKTPTEGDDKELAIFCRYQRRRKVLNILPKDVEDTLNSINFIWDVTTNIITFDQRIVQLKKYIELYGDTKIPARFSDFNKLGEWAKTMRTRKRKGTLSLEKIKTLDSLDFCWDPKIVSANEQLEEAIKYISDDEFKNKNFRCPKKLSNYMTNLRAKYNNGELDKETIDKLNKAGFVWDPVDSTWEKRLNQLSDYYKKFGTFKLSKRTDYSDIDGLQTWLNRQRSLYKKGDYSAEKIKQLNDIGYDFHKVYEKPKL